MTQVLLRVETINLLVGFFLIYYRKFLNFISGSHLHDNSHVVYTVHDIVGDSY